MSYNNDKDMATASDLAYIDFSKNDEGKSLYEIVKDGKSAAAKDLKARSPQLYNEIASGESKYSNWTIKDTCDRNEKDGFYACTFDKGDGSAVVAFRGSEDYKNWDNIKQDWIRADGGLLNSVETKQQADAREYMERVNKEFGNEFDSFGVTGHSLGGNLAAHATLTAPKALYDKIDRTLNIDGPGVSDEYLLYHAGKIKERGGSIEHYQVSLVGAMLNPITGSVYAYKKTKADELFDKHSMKNMVFDDAGNMVEGEPGEEAAWAHGVSNAADDGTILPHELAALEFLAIQFGPDILRKRMNDAQVLYYTNKFKEKYSESTAGGGAVDAVFTVNMANLNAVAGKFNDYAFSARAASEEVMTIRNEMDTLLKLSSLYTWSYKMRQKSRNLERVAVKMQKLSRMGCECSEIYNLYEESVLNRV